jgi:hypothetical protein
MTLPRPVLIALLGVALCAAAFLATRSASDTNSAVTTVTPQPHKTPVHKAVKPAGKPAAPAHGAKTHKAAPAAKKPATEKSQATTPAPAQAKPVTPGNPAKPAVTGEVAKTLPAIKALAAGKVVVFFFTQPGAADDTGAAIAVRGVAHDKSVKVFRVGLGDLETYRPVLAGAGVTQIPAIVVVKAGHKGRLLQGFVDARTLRQTVADARR